MKNKLFVGLVACALAACGGGGGESLSDQQKAQFKDIVSSFDSVSKAGKTESSTTKSLSALQSMLADTTPSESDEKTKQLQAIVKEKCKVEAVVNAVKSDVSSSIASANIGGEGCPLTLTIKIDGQMDEANTTGAVTFSYLFDTQSQEVKDVIGVAHFEISGKIAVDKSAQTASAVYSGSMISTKYGDVVYAVELSVANKTVHASIKVKTADMDAILVADGNEQNATVTLNGKEMTKEEIQALSL